MTDIVEKLLCMVPVDILGGKPMLLNPDGPAAVHEIDQLRNEIINFRTEIERLRKALYEIYDLDGDLNMGNYTDDDVRALNNAFIKTYYIARDALEGK